MPSFNLADEPWIPCLLPNGKADELSLLDILVQAHDIKEIFDPSPLVVTALHRLLLAILHRSFNGPASLEEWKTLWQRRHWDKATLEGYFNQWGHRFYLFHPERPFYQVPPIGEVKEPQPIQKLAEEVAVGNNPTLFDHNFEEHSVTVSPGIAARLLLAHQAFALQGGNSTPFNLSNAPLVRGYTVLMLGENLFETLALNLIEYSRSRPFEWKDGDDPPVWERKELPTATIRDKGGTRPRGYLDYLTWQSRRIHLILEGSPPRVNRCQIRQNFKVPDDSMHLYDPFKSYVVVKNEIRFLQVNPERAVWRDSYSLFQKAHSESASRGIFEWLANIYLDLAKPGKIEARKEYGFLVTGLANNKGKAELWHQERLPLPLAYLEDKELLSRLNDALSLADSVSRLLRNHLRDVAKVLLDPKTDPSKAGKPDTKALRQGVDNLLKSWAPDRLYFSQLEAPFRELLVKLPEDREEDEDADIDYGQQTLPQWSRVLRQAAQEAFDTVAAGLGGSPRALKAVALVEDKFRRALNIAIRKLSPGGDHESEE